jgi:hypothetical protein
MDSTFSANALPSTARRVPDARVRFLIVFFLGICVFSIAILCNTPIHRRKVECVNNSILALSKDPKFCSHKFKSCAFRYMIAVSVYQSKIIGIYKTYPGGYSEIEIFCDHIKTLFKQGKYVVADKGNLH